MRFCGLPSNKDITGNAQALYVWSESLKSVANPLLLTGYLNFCGKIWGRGGVIPLSPMRCSQLSSV